MSNKFLFLPGDGIGPEVVNQAAKVAKHIATLGLTTMEIEYSSIGGEAIDNGDDPLPSSTLDLAKKADGILLGAVGGPKWDKNSKDKKPEKGLLDIRKELNLFANIRPALLFPQLSDASSLKSEVISGLDIIIVRELTGGLYFGEPRGVDVNENKERKAFNTMVYSESEIRRIIDVACKLSMMRGKKLCSVDKANVLEVSQLWREIASETVKNYPELELTNMYVDNAAMQLISNPKQFDVIVTENLFGDILSDSAAMLTGSIGMLPSASLSIEQKGLYEPVHGSAPELAGKNVANPIATILSLAMMFEMTLNAKEIADLIRNSVSMVLQEGFRTVDLLPRNELNDIKRSKDPSKSIGTNAMGDEICNAMTKITEGM